MNHEKRKKIRKLISFIFILLVLVGEVILAITVELKVGFFNTNNLRKAVSASNYASVAKEQFGRGLDELLEKNGLPSYISEKLQSEAGIYNRIHANLERTYSGEIIEAGTEDIADMFASLLSPYVSAGTIGQTEADSMNEELRELCRETLVFEFGNDTLEITNKYREDRIITIAAAILTMILSMLCMWNMYRYKHRAVRTLLHASMAATVINILFSICVVFYKNTYTEKYSGFWYKETVVQFYKCGLGAFAVISAVMILVCILVYGLYKHLRENF